MKTKLLLLFTAMPFAGFCQAPINSFFGSSGANYAVIDPSVAAGAEAGADATWDFADAQPLGVSTYSEQEPTAEELATFPNTTSVAVNTAVSEMGTAEARIYINEVGSDLSITGAIGNDLVLNYITNNAEIGTIPASFGYTNTDASAGTFTFQEYEGTFVGTINTTVDAYGDLTIGLLGIPSMSGPATRIKVVQELTLSSGIFVNVGTVTQTSYNYYLTDEDFDNPAFKTMEITVAVPLLGINETQSIFETFLSPQMGVAEQNIAAIAVAPNPVESTLQISLADGMTLQSVAIADLNGRVIRNINNPMSSVDVSDLSSGMYILTANSDAGSKTLKFVKK